MSSSTWRSIPSGRWPRCAAATGSSTRRGAPIDRLHVRLMNSGLEFVDVDLPAARLELDDQAFAYRIYRLDSPMRPGEERCLRLPHPPASRSASGPRAPRPGSRPNGTDLNSLELDSADRHERRRPDRGSRPAPRIRPPRTAAPPPAGRSRGHPASTPNGDLSWTTADITDLDDRRPDPDRSGPEGVGARRERPPDRPLPVRHSDQESLLVPVGAATPSTGSITGASSMQSTSTRRIAGTSTGCWTTMRASIDYYRKAFGPYQFDQTRIVETPAYRRGGGQAFPNTIAVGEPVFAWNVGDPERARHGHHAHRPRGCAPILGPSAGAGAGCRAPGS